MARMFRHKRSASLLLLAYLLVGAGFGNALLWCRDAQAFSHLEFNLAGKCQGSCHPGEEGRGHGGPTEPSAPAWAAADCLDIPVCFAHAVPPQAGKLSAAPLLSGWPALPAPVRSDSPVADLTSLNPAAQPPPSPALALLRTVVLLN